MWIRGLMYRAMQEAGVEGGGGGGGVTGADGSGGNDEGLNNDAGASQRTGSLLKQGEGGAEPLSQDFIPEKYRVSKEDGTFDLEASARKMAEAHGHLEKRIGQGDLPPKSSADYSIDPPEGMKDLDLRGDADMASFLEKAHAAGITQKQMDLVMGEYFRLAPMLAQGAATLDEQGAAAELKATWANDADFTRNIGMAHAAASFGASRAGLDMEQVYSAIGNNPTAMRLLAAIGAEFQEDSTPAGGAVPQLSGEDRIRELELSEAYRNPRHHDHAKVSEQVRRYYERKHGTAPVG
ncbi:hypothetical protein RVU96_16805 [Bordetella avium]|uniref:hypothetical protein n=1 Tax=Bordetella avium TaxID=521 RepID=UPI000E0B38DE|nr:hypothetical protein [Bordetella avium]RIQ11574.1 hypothetical protein D0432_16325 [Bordetella avium]RIQ44927.1 hypothetical protein D0845_17115 [Bordetella avium]RIQ49577.1 hypothetical protein D0844_16410 [Bordetella avium]RIQ55326.1 hypothetical protein D0841_16540 [Bordetella avium]RIQ58422.1 hypothetical protein D0842_16505 [Bordetella avium]